jgi:hypothetical protein
MVVDWQVFWSPVHCFCAVVLLHLFTFDRTCTTMLIIILIIIINNYIIYYYYYYYSSSVTNNGQTNPFTRSLKLFLIFFVIGICQIFLWYCIVRMCVPLYMNGRRSLTFFLVFAIPKCFDIYRIHKCVSL